MDPVSKLIAHSLGYLFKAVDAQEQSIQALKDQRDALTSQIETATAFADQIKALRDRICMLQNPNIAPSDFSE
jgi:ABC-type transporter Mla subunit MlaD